MNELKAITDYMARNDLMSFAPAAALIDMDGTLYDSMPHHADAWYRLMTERGVNCTHDEFFMYEGRTGVSTINLLFNREFHHDASPEEAAALYKKKTVYFSEMPLVDVMPGAKRMIETLQEKHIATVLVTGSGQNTLLNRLESDFPGAFPENMRITSRDVKHGKPNPEPFLKAMQLVGLYPENCIAIDNAPLGVMAGAASGAFTIGVKTGPIPEEALREAGADIVYSSMNELADNLHILLNPLTHSI